MELSELWMLRRSCLVRTRGILISGLSVRDKMEIRDEGRGTRRSPEWERKEKQRTRFIIFGPTYGMSSSSRVDLIFLGEAGDRSIRTSAYRDCPDLDLDLDHEYRLTFQSLKYK